MTSISFGLALIGSMLLSLSLKRHWQQVWPGNDNFRRWVLPNRVAGYGGVALALLPCIRQSGLWIGLVLWISILALAAFIQALLLTYWPRRSWLLGSASMMLVVWGLLS